MKNGFSETIRDILLFSALIILIREAFDRTKAFVAEHKESVVHQLDQNFIDQLYATQRHLHFIEQQEAYSYTHGSDIADIKNRLAMIEEKYKKNSPALGLLGPIGTAAVVTKEEQLQGKLLKAANDISALLYRIHNQPESFTAAATLVDAIENNKALAKRLIA